MPGRTDFSPHRTAPPPAAFAPSRAPADPKAYWSAVASAWRARGHEGPWRAVSDAINEALIARWLPRIGGGSVLKTDLFDEYVGRGLVPTLASRFSAVAGVDISAEIVDAVGELHPALAARRADVRALPFESASFDAIVSNSTLDHFQSREDIATALAELYRVLRPGGTLLITLDNAVNPVIAIRNALPERVRAATHLVPYAVGATTGPAGLRQLLERCGFTVRTQSAVVHCPRLLAVLAGRLVDRHGGPVVRRRYTQVCTAFESLAALPTRYLTGHFVAALAVKRG